MARRGRGRPPGDSGTREAIIAEARRQFAERGYGPTTLRSVAQAVGVDPRLVLHYFGSKQDLFAESVELPIQPEFVLANAFGPDGSFNARRAATLIATVLDDPDGRRPILALLRAAVTEPEAAESIRKLLVERMLGPIAQRVGGDRPELRASLVASQVVGLALARHVVGVPPLASASRDDLVEALTPVLEHYLRGDWLQR